MPYSRRKFDPQFREARSRIYLHGRGFHHAVPKARGVAVAAEAFSSRVEHEVLSRRHFTTKAHARQVVVARCHDFYNSRRRHSSAALTSPIQYATRSDQQAAA